MFLRSFLRCVRGAAGLALLALLFPALSEAQALHGRVVLPGGGVTGVEVELHRVTRDSSGVVGRANTTADGNFSLSLPPVDTAGFTVFFATAEHLGIRYFGAPIHPGQPHPEEYSIAVYDTVAAASAPFAVQVPRRDIVLLPRPDRGWEVNEILQVENPGTATLVSLDGKPTWEFRIPANATAFELGEGEIAATEIARMEDRVLLLLPLVPGRREIFLRYLLPPQEREFQVPIDSRTETLNLYVQQPSPALTVHGLESQTVIEAEGEQFLHFQGTGIDASSTVLARWEGPAAPPVDPTTAAIVVVGLVLLAGIGAAWWRRGPRDDDTHPNDRNIDIPEGGAAVRQREVEPQTVA